MSKQPISALLSVGVALLATCCASQAWAVEPHYIKLSDSMVFVPGLQLKESYDDNIHADERDELSSWVTTVTPGFTLAGEGSKSSYLLNYTASSDTFHASTQDNNTDHSLLAKANLEFTARHRLQLSSAYSAVENVVTRNQAQENNRSENVNLDGVYTYGARTARGQIDLAGRYEEIRYNNSNGLNSENERDSTTLRSTFYYRVAPQTRLLLEFRHADHDYLSAHEDSSVNLDLLAGVTWEATAKTSGTLKFGRGQKRYDDSRLDNASTGMWEAAVTWKPRTYSTFNLSTRRSFDEGSDNSLLADGSGDGSNLFDSDDGAVKLQTHSLNWKHYWQKHLYSDLGYSYTDLQYLDSEREDELTGYNLGLTYEARRWLDIGIGYRHSENDSTRRSENYQRNVYALTISASL